MTATAMALIGAGVPAAARADVSVADKLVATQLFKEGRALLDQGQVAQACQKLEESQRLDPGGGTLLNVAVCHERAGRTASAWEEFTEALGLAKRDGHVERAEFARAHIAQLEPTLSRLFVLVPPAADVPELEVKRDGSHLGRAAWGSAIPVDPGDHLIEVSAPGKMPWRQSVVAGTKGDTKTVVVPVLQDLVPFETPPVAPALQSSTGERDRAGGTLAVGAGPAVPPPSSSSSIGASRHGEGTAAAAWIALGLGAVAAGVGTYFAVHAIAQKSDADNDCPGNRCSANGANENSDAIKSANFATAGFIVGGVGVGLGVVLFAVRAAQSPASESGFIAPGSPFARLANAVSFGPSDARIRFTGQW